VSREKNKVKQYTNDEKTEPDGIISRGFTAEESTLREVYESPHNKSREHYMAKVKLKKKIRAPSEANAMVLKPSFMYGATVTSLADSSAREGKLSINQKSKGSALTILPTIRSGTGQVIPGGSLQFNKITGHIAATSPDAKAADDGGTAQLLEHMQVYAQMKEGMVSSPSEKKRMHDFLLYGKTGSFTRKVDFTNPFK